MTPGGLCLLHGAVTYSSSRMLQSFCIFFWSMRSRLPMLASGRDVMHLETSLSFPTEVIVSSPLHWKFIEMVCRPVSWHQQHYTYALRQAPQLLCLMIKRYTRHFVGPHKNTTFMDYQVGATLWLPVFGSARGLDVTWRGYSILGMIVHTGNSVRSGHYTAFLSGYRRYPTAHRWVTLLADDGRPVKDANEHQLQHSRCNNYIIGLVSLGDAPALTPSLS